MSIFKRKGLFTCLFPLAAALCMSAAIGIVGGGSISASADTDAVDDSGGTTAETTAENTTVTWGTVSGNEYTDNGITWTYTLNGDNATLTSCSYTDATAAADITVPGTVGESGEYTVTTLGTGLFAISTNWNTDVSNQNTILKSLTIPASVTTIEYRSIFMCTALETITIKSTSLTLGSEALGTYSKWYGSLSNGTIIVFEGLTSEIDSSATISNGSVRQIQVANGDMLEYVKGVFATGTTAYISSNTEVYWTLSEVDGANKWILTGTASVIVDNVMWSFTADENDNATITKYSSELSGISVPETLTYYGKMYNVTAIGGGAFANSTNWTESYTNNNRNTTLTFVTIPSCITSIGQRAFYFCTSLTSITIDSESLSLGTEAFNTYTAWYGGNSTGTIITFTALTSLTLPESEVISNGSIRQIKVANVSTLEAVKNAFAEGTKAWLLSEDEKVTAYWTLESGDDGNQWSTMAGTASVTVDKVTWYFTVDENNNATITDYVSSDAEIVIPDTLTFGGTDYTVTAIGEGAFAISTSWDTSEDNLNTALTSVTIPASVTSIGKRAFFFCTALQTIIFESNNTSITIATEAFTTGTVWYGNLANGTTIYVNNSSLQTCIAGYTDANTKAFVITGGNALSDEVYNGTSLYALEQSGKTFMGYSAESGSSYTVYTAKWDEVTVGGVTATMAYVDGETNALYVKISDTSSFTSGTALTVSGTDISGYLYAGWYSYDGAEYTALSAVPSGEGWVKFIDSSILATTYTVTYDSTTGKATVSFTSSVDSLNYSGIGFVTTINGKVSTFICTSVNSQYGFTYNLKNISSGNFSKTIYVKAYYKTLDGAIVYGNEVSFIINDYISN